MRRDALAPAGEVRLAIAELGPSVGVSGGGRVACDGLGWVLSCLSVSA
jgi:hypothetical protein